MNETNITINFPPMPDPKDFEVSNNVEVNNNLYLQALASWERVACALAENLEELGSTVGE